MSKLNVNRNIFLEKEELSRLQQFLGPENVITQVMLDNTSKWGIVKTDFENTNPPDFRVEAGSNAGTIKIANISKAVDKNKNLIYQEAIDNIPVPTVVSSYYWVKISHQYKYNEVGECSVNVDGSVNGLNTKFLEVLRGQNTEVPVKIKFYKSSGLLNNQIYEVVDVIDDTNIILVGSSFVAESGLNYIVIGATPIGEVLTNEQKIGLYWYDSCNIEFVPEEIEGQPPVNNYLVDEDFYIARVKNNSGTVSIEDKRGTQYITFNVEGLKDKLDKAKNLSDLTDKAAARANLGVSSSQEIDESYFKDYGWKPMIKGINVNSVGFDVKIRRLGKNVCITGKFKLVGNLVANEVLFSIPLSDVGGITIVPSTKIYSQINTIETEENNHGLRMYIDNNELTYLAIKSGDNCYVPSPTWTSEYYFTLNYLCQ